MKKNFCIFILIMICIVFMGVTVNAYDAPVDITSLKATSIEHTVTLIPDVDSELSIVTNINSSRPVYINIYKDDELVIDHRYTNGNDSYTYTYSGTNNKLCEFKIKIHDITNYGYPVDAEIIVYQNHTYSSWALTFINEAIRQNKIPTDLQNNYSTNITREDFCRIAYQFMDDYIDKTYVESIFADTDRAEINNLANIGILKGKGKNIFAPYDNITREDAAVILERMAQKMSIMRENESFRTFDDEASVSSYAISSVQNITRLCIMEGKANNRFCPKDLLTKEEAIATFIRLSGLQN